MAEYSLAGFARFCERLRLEGGRRMELEPYQQTMLAPHFEDATELVIVIPKKNGKTTLLAALALYHLATVEEAECVIGASSRDQARILFKQAAGLVRRSKMDDVFDVKGGYGEVRLKGQKDGARIRVLAADATTADGVIPTLALVDELHRHPSSELYGVFRDGLGPRDGRMITISTAGAVLDSPLGRLREKAYGMPSFCRDDASKHNFAASEDGSFVMHEWCLASGEDVDDMDLVFLANPASWQTVEKLRQRHDSPSVTPWQWRRFACGVWTEGEEPWIAPELWDDLLDRAVSISATDKAFLGVDVGVRHDTTALVLVSWLDGKLVVKAYVMVPPEGGKLLLEDIEARIRELCEEFTVEAIVFDPWSFRRSAELLESEGLPMMEFPQSPERMAAASANLYRLIEAGELVHDGDPVLRSHVMAGVTKETERGWRLMKDPKMSRPIDALIALAVAALPAVALVNEPEPWFAFA